MDKLILSFIAGFLSGILFLVVLWNTIDPFTWTSKNTPSTACVRLNFKEVQHVVQATIFCPAGRMSPMSGPGYVVQFTGFGPESNPIEPVYERHWGWVQVVLPKEHANSD